MAKRKKGGRGEPYSVIEPVADIDAIRDKQSLIREHMNDLPQEKRTDKLISFEKWLPVLERLGDPDDMSVEEILTTATPLSVIKMLDLMMTAKSETVQATCARDIAYMGGLKPVEKSQNVNVNVMSRNEATALLRSKLEKFGIDVFDGTDDGEDQDENEIQGEIIPEDGEGQDRECKEQLTQE